MMTLSLLVVAACTTWIVAGTGALLRALARPPLRPARPRALSVLKPLCGRDPALEPCLRSFFEQDHPEYELVFGAEDADDPGLALARALAAEHPHVRVAFVVHGGRGALNPKVANLTAMLPVARYDRVLISDATVRAPRHYLTDASATADAPGVGLVTHTFAGVGERTLGAALENVQLNGFVAAGAAFPTALGDAAVVGKSMVFSRARFEALGGFASVRDVLAEDFMIGKMFQHAGHRVITARVVLDSVNGAVSLRAALGRQLRWSMLRLRLRSLAFALEPVTNPLLVLPLAWPWLGAWALAWAAALYLVRDVVPWIALRGWRRAYLPLGLAPLRDLLMGAVWAVTPFKKHVAWRGHRVRVGPGTHVFQVPDARRARLNLR